ncbi:MAG: GNAT family N-acetyltransferase [Candidatus Neomarinimicrobiota bacterium]
MQRTVTVFYLEINDISAQPPTVDIPGFDFRRALIPCPEINRFFYTTIGKNWNWIDRLPWTKENWFDYLKRPELETWIAYLDGTPAGYTELEIQKEQTVQISYLGVLPQFSGKGLGKAMLSSGILRSKELQARRVWLIPNFRDARQPGGIEIIPERRFPDLQRRNPDARNPGRLSGVALTDSTLRTSDFGK